MNSTATPDITAGNAGWPFEFRFAVHVIFCASSAEARLGGICPNCGGDLVIRPHRPASIHVQRTALASRFTG